jgi:hypothetical protein
MSSRTLLIAAGFTTGTLLAASAPGLATSPTEGSLVGRGIEGQIRTSQGAPIPGVVVTLQQGDRTVRRTSDARGRFFLPTLARGSYPLLLEKDGYSPLKHNLKVAYDEQEAKVALVMLPVASATVEVVASAAPVRFTDLELSPMDLAGVADSSSMGVVSPERLENRPVLRVGEVLETVPGFIVTQHSGGGKANQYFCRGFNIDHGTDFATTIDGIPINLPTHAHGQGYSDANFLIPELVSGIQYWKGPYEAGEGDFSAAGAANINYVHSLDQGISSLEAGALGYRRLLTADSTACGKGTLLGAVELYHYDGAWTSPDDYSRHNGVLSYSQGTLDQGFTVTGFAYTGNWNATNQMPERAIQEGLIDRFGNLDPSDGGRTYRYALAFDGRTTGEAGTTRLQSYLVSYGVDLWTNFTFFLLDPVNGDQIRQSDRRTYGGLDLSHLWNMDVGGVDVAGTVGLQARHDQIHVGLFHTKDRVQLGVDNDNDVSLTSLGLYGSTEWRFSPFFRATLGARLDDQAWNVDAWTHPVNSGSGSKALVSPKLALAFGPWGSTEFYLDAGQSYHSNDMRGVTKKEDDATGQPVAATAPLVRARGAEVGFRTRPVSWWQTAFTVWGLDMDSELEFDADTGDMQPEGATRRIGFESSNDFSPRPWFNVDCDFAFSRARYRDPGPGAGDYVPEAIEGVGSLGVALKSEAGHTLNLRLRYFGPRALVQDDSVRSASSTVLQAGFGYQASKHVRLQVEAMNVLNAKVNDIEYYYATRLQGEPAAGVNDRLVHPADPRSVRFATIIHF